MNLDSLVKYKITALFIFLLCAASLLNCNPKSSSDQPAINNELLIRGKQLSEQYCQRCHLYPAPELLNKESWSQVLPVMEAEMAKSSIPITSFEWITIQDYYNKVAPVELDKSKVEMLKKQVAIFNMRDSITIQSTSAASVSMVAFNEAKNLLCTGNIQGDVFLIKKTTVVKKFHIDNIPVGVHMNSADKGIDILAIGNLLPSEELKGGVIRFDSMGNQALIIDSLKRPVHFLSADFNNDGKEEYLISCFGSQLGRTYSGNLSLFTATNGIYREYLLKSMPGATKTVVGDFNGDNKLDFMALFSQAKESIRMFINKGNFHFEEKLLLEFLPVYGSNDFELADINGDSFVDIIYTNGDNFDFSPIIKSYHGVRIFINNGRNEFKEKFFFHINGASKVLVRDFDSDHDLDLFVLAMYPDLEERAQETLVYLENTGNLNFEPAYVEKEPTGKWLVMDAGDVDADGDEDVVVGSNLLLSIPHPEYYDNKWSKSPKSYLVLLNTADEAKTDITLWKKIKNYF